ncbi:MAG: GNAT family N-acetyltransferase [Halanaerobiales bacterium]
MKLDFVSKNEKDQILELMKYCFLIDEDTLNWIGEEMFRAENCLAVYDDKKIAASLQVLPFEIFFQGKPVPMGGISAVCTLPEYRSKHYAGDLLQEAIKLMHDRGQMFSMLAPFSYHFYRQYGWELAFQTSEYEFDVSNFKKFKKAGIDGFKPLEYDDIPGVKDVYEKYICRYNGALRRSDRDWNIEFQQHERKDKYRYGCTNEDGELQGYLFFKIKDRKMNIGELCYNSIDIKRKIFAFIYSHRSQIDKVGWNAPADDNTILMLDEPTRSHKFGIEMMARVVDMKQVLKRLNTGNNISGVSFALKVEDKYAKWNNRIFRVEVDDGEVEVDVLEDVDPDIICAVQPLSQMILGYAVPEQSWELGKIKGDREKIEELALLLPDRKTFMNDYF